MPTGIADRWEAGLAINGQEIFLTDESMIEMSVKSGIHRNLPTATIVINDKGADVTDGIRPQDGMPVDILMGDGKGGPKYTGAFRITGKPIAYYTSQGVIVKINCLYDALAWSKAVVAEHFDGTSSGLIAKLAGQAGLGSEVDATNDAMTWLPNRKPYVRYARMAAERGWASAMSCMVFSVTNTGILRYRDVNNLMRAGAGRIFGLNGDILVHQFHAASKAPIYNSAAAYGSTTLFQGLDGKIQSLDKIGATMFGSGFGFSDVMSGFVGALGTRVDSNPIDALNTHKNYYQAKHQNRRIKATYGNDVHILTRNSSGVVDFDTVQYNCMHPITGQLLEEYSGIYTVTNMVLTIQKRLYSERITLTNQGGSA